MAIFEADDFLNEDADFLIVIEQVPFPAVSEWVGRQAASIHLPNGCQ